MYSAPMNYDEIYFSSQSYFLLLKNDMLKGIEGNVSLLSSFIVINFIKVIKLMFNK